MSPKNLRSVTVVIPTYNAVEVLERCLDALAAQTYPDFETTVVDNGSSDGTEETIRKDYPHVEVVRLNRNDGFAKAVNVAIHRCRSPYVLLLNNDTLPRPDFIEKLLEAAESAPPDVGGINPLVLFMDSSTIDNIGIKIRRRWKAGQIGMYEKTGWQPGKTVEIFGANAGSSIFRKAFFDDVGLFDEDFVSYREDVDLSIRGRLKGWRFYHCPSAVVLHHHSYTGKKIPETSAFLSRRNYLYYVLKSAPLRVFWGLLAYLCLKDIGNIVHFLKTPKGRAEFKRNIRAYFSLLMHCRAMFRKRHENKGRSFPERVLSWMECDYRDI